jgi:hypothetical protein
MKKFTTQENIMTTRKENIQARNRQRQHAHELDGIPGFIDSYDYRCDSDDSPELMNNTGFLSTLTPTIRDLMESSDFYVVLGDYVDPAIMADHRSQDGTYDRPIDEVEKVATLHNIPLKTIRRRNPEFQQHLLHEDMDEEEIERREESEDALDHADSFESPPPKATFDIVEDLRKGYSANWFPYPRDKRIQGYSRNLMKAVENGMHAKALYNAVTEAKKRNVITKTQIRQLWDTHNLMSFQRNPEQYMQRIQRRKSQPKI